MPGLDRIKIRVFLVVLVLVLCLIGFFQVGGAEYSQKIIGFTWEDYIRPVIEPYWEDVIHRQKKRLSPGYYKRKFHWVAGQVLSPHIAMLASIAGNSERNR
jgi:hypothetical protein